MRAGGKERRRRRLDSTAVKTTDLQIPVSTRGEERRTRGKGRRRGKERRIRGEEGRTEGNCSNDTMVSTSAC